MSPSSCSVSSASVKRGISSLGSRTCWRTRGARVRASRSLKACDDNLVSAGLGAPDLAWSAEELAHLGGGAGQREGIERLLVGLEADQGVCAEVGEPDNVTFIDVHGVGLRVASW